MSTTPITHDPDARLDYSWDWSGWLTEGETITSASVTAPDALVVPVGEVTRDGASVTAWVTVNPAAPRNVVHRVVCHVVTSAGREDDRSHHLIVSPR